LKLKNKNLDSTQLIPIGALFVTLCSSVNYIIYYGFFNIRIINYLTITEYASLFMEHIIAYLIIILGGIITHFLYKNMFSAKDKGIVVFCISVAIIYTLVRLFFFSEKIHERIYEITFIIYYSIFLVLYLKQMKNKKLNILVYLAIVSIVFSISSGLVSAYKIIENDNKLNYIFKFKEYSIPSSETYIYLGKSEKYLFFYNNKEKISEIISIKDIVKITVKEKKTKDNNVQSYLLGSSRSTKILADFLCR
jgi:hypothetical protein